MRASEAATIRHAAREPEGWTGKGYYEEAITHYSYSGFYPEYIEHVVDISVTRDASGFYAAIVVRDGRTIDGTEGYDFSNIARFCESWEAE